MVLPDSAGNKKGNNAMAECSEDLETIWDLTQSRKCRLAPIIGANALRIHTRQWTMMIRLAHFPEEVPVKIGMVTAAPGKQSFEIHFDDLFHPTAEYSTEERLRLASSESV
jgi:regulation of enolase protein 1 (concanavalin A-like superfamily)